MEVYILEDASNDYELRQLMLEVDRVSKGGVASDRSNKIGLTDFLYPFPNQCPSFIPCPNQILLFLHLQNVARIGNFAHNWCITLGR